MQILQQLENFICLKKVKNDEVIMKKFIKKRNENVANYKEFIKKRNENVAKLTNKSVTSSRVFFTLSRAAFLPDIVGKKKLQQEDLVASTIVHFIDAEKNFEKQNQKLTKIV